MKNYDDPWEDLAYAIVVSAITEYKFAFRRCGSRNESMRDYYSWKVRSLENFFQSEWCYLITGIDGDTIIKAVRAGVNRKDPPNNRKGKAGGVSQQVGVKRKDPGVNRKEGGGQSQRNRPQNAKKVGAKRKEIPPKV